MPTTCGFCGAPLLPTMRFCTSCGAANPTFGAAAPEPQEPPTQASPDAFVEPPTAPYQAVPPAAPYQAAPPTAPYQAAPQQPTSQPTQQPAYQQPFEQPTPQQAQQYPDQRYAPPSQQPATAWEQPATPKKSKRGVFVVIGLLVLLLAASGAGIWWFLLRDGDTTSGGSATDISSADLPQPITDEPEKAWSWPVTGSYSTTAVGNYVAVGSEEGVRLFSSSDQPLWTNEDATVIRSGETPDGKVWGWHASDRTAVLIDLKTGDTDESYEGWNPYGLIGTTGNSLLVQNDEETYEITDAKVVDGDGKDLFDLPEMSQLSWDGDLLYLADDDGTLTAVSGKDGKEKWEAEIPSWTADPEKPLDAPQFAHLSGDHFFLRTADGLEMRSKSNGRVVENDKTDDLECGYLMQVAPFMAACAPERSTDFSADPEAQSVVFFDADGEKGTLETEQPYFSAIEQGKDWYLVNHGDNVVYDTSFSKVGQLTSDEEGNDPDIAFTQDGVYVAGDTLELKSLKGAPEWSVDIPTGTPDDSKAYLSDVVATDDLVVVFRDGVITAWKR